MKKPGESETKPPLAVPNQLARLFRALTPYTQKEFGERTGIHRSTIGHIENGDEEPSAGHLEAMARAARTSVEAGREMLRWHESQDRPRVRAGLGVEALYARVGEEFRARLERAYQSLLRLPALADGKQGIDEQMALLELADETERSTVVKSWTDFQTHALADRVARKAAEEAPRDGDGSAAWERLAQEIARLAAGTPEKKV